MGTACSEGYEHGFQLGIFSCTIWGTLCKVSCQSKGCKTCLSYIIIPNDAVQPQQRGSCKHIQLTERATYSSKHEPQLEKGGPYSNPYSRRRCIGNWFIAELHFRKLILEFSSRWISDMVLHAKACIVYIEGIRALHLYISIVLLVPTTSSFIKFV